MAAKKTGQDLVAGETNKAQDGTELIGFPGHDDDPTRLNFFGNEYVLRIESPQFGTIDGIRSQAFGGIGVSSTGRTGVLGTGSTVGVSGSGKKGVVGVGNDPEAENDGGNGTGVEGTGSINGVVGFGRVQGVVGHGPKAVVGFGEGERAGEGIGVEGNGKI